MFLRPRSWFPVLRAAFGTVTVLSILIVFFTVGPAIETRWFPVLSKMRITEAQAVGDRASIVRTEFAKLRNCDYIGIAWYHGAEAGVFERVAMVPIRDPDDTSSPNLAVGQQRAGPWRITIPVSDVRAHSFVQVYHRCHPFWTTMTKFYP